MGGAGASCLPPQPIGQHTPPVLHLDAITPFHSLEAVAAFRSTVADWPTNATKIEPGQEVVCLAVDSKPKYDRSANSDRQHKGPKARSLASRRPSQTTPLRSRPLQARTHAHVRIATRCAWTYNSCVDGRVSAPYAMCSRRTSLASVSWCSRMASLAVCKRDALRDARRTSARARPVGSAMSNQPRAGRSR